jgi:hypothetical protein
VNPGSNDIEDRLIEVGRWLESVPLSAGFSAADRVAGFVALDRLRHSRLASLDAALVLERLAETALAAGVLPGQALTELRALVAVIGPER